MIWEDGLYISMTRRAAIALLASAASGAISPAAAQSDYPSRRINVLVPYPAGGIVDIAMRVVTEKVSKILGQPITIENKPGANGNLGTDLAARAEPDGYTWVFMGPATLANPHIYPGLRWSEKSFTTVGITSWAPAALIVNPSSPANTVKEFVELAKKSPGALNFGNAGVGSSSHLNAVLFMQGNGIQLTTVPYTGQPAFLTDMMADRIQFGVAAIGLSAEHVKAKKLKALAVIGNQRSSLLPDVPTMTEAGFGANNLVPWYGLAVPKDTPRPIAERINAAINEALKDASIRELYEKQALDVIEPKQLKDIEAIVAKDSDLYARIVKDANIKINQ
jgi:tripartite-type tricarboxylate transporter receptor subunit TctC